MSDAPARPRRLSGLALGLSAVVLVAAVVGAFVLGQADVVTEEDVDSAVLTALQGEAAEGFVVTGRLTSSLSGRSARRQRLRVLNIETGRASVRVEVPAEMTYGFSLDRFSADDVRFREGGLVEVVLPPLEVFSVEPILEEADVNIETTGGARLSPDLTEQTLEQTLRRVRPALRTQAETYVRDADQPRVNTARALRRVLAAPLEAAGVDLGAVRFRFVLAPGDTLDVGADGRRRSVPAG
jgi:hypothetical protein